MLLYHLLCSPIVSSWTSWDNLWCSLGCLWFLFFGVFNAHAEVASQDWLRISSVLISIWFYAYRFHSMFNLHFLLLDAVTEGLKSGTTLKLINIFCGPSWFEFEISDLHETIGGGNMQLWRGECIHYAE